MSLDVTTCGLIVIPDREPQGYECGLYYEELTELDLSVAINFTRARLADQGLGNVHPDVHFIAASFHPGKAPQCPGIEFADQPVDVQEEEEEHATDLQLREYTVCGFYADNWQTYSGYHKAISPHMAYWDAWQDVQAEGRYLYVANVHSGRWERHPVPGTDEPPAFGDPDCRTAEEMASLMNGWLEGA